jgi:DNA modification methylase
LVVTKIAQVPFGLGPLFWGRWEDYGDLAKLAARVLKPGRPCLAMVGQIRMPEVLDALRTELRYTWTLAYLTRENTRPTNRKVQASSWLPVLLFVARGDDRIGAHGADLFQESYPKASLREHPWQKDATALGEMITAFSNPGDLAFDPFTGSGTTAVAAVGTGRRFVGIDIDKKAVALATKGVAAVKWGGARVKTG